MSTQDSRRRPWKPSLLVFAVALLARGVAAFWGSARVPPTADGKYYHVFAGRLAEGQGYTWLWEDGTVTSAAHFPVGYPALISGFYRVFGATPSVAMGLNALLGAIGCVAAHRLALFTVAHFSGRFGADQPAAERAALLAALVAALSPTLVGYTPAMMTEGPVAVFVALAAWAAVASREARSRGSRALWLVVVALLMGVAVLVRPQAILLAPVVGFLAWPGGVRGKLFGAGAVLTGALLVAAPWISRNCEKMDRCVFVSANGGWNLLIGTFPEGRGGWAPVDGDRVPADCREVFEEAAKDHCFRQAGLRRIKEQPGPWLSLIPAKLRVTFDHTGAAAAHLKEAGAIGEDAWWRLGALEIVFQRISHLVVLLGTCFLALSAAPARRRGLLLLTALGALGFLGLGAFVGWLAVLWLGLVWGASEVRDAGAQRSQEATSDGSERDGALMGLAVGFWGLVFTFVVHAVFFGAGRYSMPLLIWQTPALALGIFACFWAA